MEQGHALLSLEAERCDHLTAILTPLAEAGDVRAARELIRVMERRARMLGIDLAGQREAMANTDTAAGILGAFAKALHAAHDQLPGDAE